MEVDGERGCHLRQALRRKITALWRESSPVPTAGQAESGNLPRGFSKRKAQPLPATRRVVFDWHDLPTLALTLRRLHAMGLAEPLGRPLRVTLSPRTRRPQNLTGEEVRFLVFSVLANNIDPIGSNCTEVKTRAPPSNPMPLSVTGTPRSVSTVAESWLVNVKPEIHYLSGNFDD